MKFVFPLIAALSIAVPALAQTDPHQWLEGVETPASLAWVAQENAKTTAVLQGDPRYSRLHDEALAILSADDRVPSADFIGPSVFSFWQNAQHVRGVWRRTRLRSYATGERRWETVLDLDALSKAENATWVWKRADCAAPAYTRCLISLSEGGKDAVEVREFDLATRRFVEGGFRFPEGKQSVEWLDPDTVIFTRAADGATESGYGYVIRTLKRGRPIGQAAEVFRGQAADVAVSPHVFEDAQGRKAVVLERGTDFFHSEFHLLTDAGVRRLPLPQRARLEGLVDGRLIVLTAEPWRAAGHDAPIPAGSLVAAPLDGGPVEYLFKPDARLALDRENVEVTRNRVVAVAYDNVRGRIMSFGPGPSGWTATQLPAAENAAIVISSASDIDDQVFYTVEGFLTPTQLKVADAATGSARTTNTMPARFRTRGLVVEQHQATSKDGTAVPYFLVRHKDAPLDGRAATLLHGYGGFQISKTPLYEATLGKLWLEKGGAYAVANIRGGGEFGPAWHEAALNGNRQRAFDDFTAVAEDLIARKVTSPPKLGIYGRSNGGLLMGAAMTQRPDLYNAVIIESPLLDMLRYHELPAGASWIGEYGDPRIPEEAAWIGAYSPYQALKPGVTYPPAYITTNTRDDRVHPGHARKFAARLAELGRPYLYYEDTEGGHANGADPHANAVRWGMHYTYLMQRLMD
ncbi:MAG TPA: prolyl oligopeptidase family serine peptidase [Caulobacteraceae bacterium]|nr:prolyl oligopeptidase family serine peptidase [Caulobacteraceae bacterium]